MWENKMITDYDDKATEDLTLDLLNNIQPGLDKAKIYELIHAALSQAHFMGRCSSERVYVKASMSFEQGEQPKQRRQAKYVKVKV